MSKSIELLKRAESGTSHETLQDLWLIEYPNEADIVLASNSREFITIGRRLTYERYQVDSLLKELAHGNLSGAASYALNYLLSKCVNITNERHVVAMLREVAPAYAGTVVKVYRDHICGPAAGDLVGFKLRTVSQQAIDRMFNKED